MIASSILALALLAAAERTPVVVLPPAADAGGAELALAMQERADELLAGAGRFHVFHERQVASMAARHGMAPAALGEPNPARQAAERLGAKRYVFSRLRGGPAGWTLELTAAEVGSPKSQASKAALPAGAAAGVEAGARALAQALAGPLPEAPPPTRSDAAMRAYAACDAALLAQPIGIETPPVLDEARLAAATARCQEAVQADGAFAAARGAMALAQAIAGGRPADAGTSPNAVLARFWVAARDASPAAGEQVLREALARDPGLLLARTYLAELYNATGRQPEAARAWGELAGIAADSPFVLSRLAYTEARLGKPEAAVRHAEQAVAFDRDSPELQLELASRYLDAGRVDPALATLKPLAARPDARAEALLRLGYAQLLKSDPAARETLQRALAAAKEPGEWRTRARAHFDLARLALKDGKTEEAQALLRMAVREGLVPPPPKPGDEALYALLPKEGAAAARPREAGPLKP